MQVRLGLQPQSIPHPENSPRMKMHRLLSVGSKGRRPDLASRRRRYSQSGEGPARPAVIPGCFALQYQLA